MIIWSEFKERLFRIWNRHFGSVDKRSAVSGVVSSLRGIAYSLGMLIVGLLSHSVILTVNGLYILFISALKGVNVVGYSRKQLAQSEDSEAVMMWTGLFVIGLAIVYCIVNVTMIYYSYPENITQLSMELTALFAFIKLGSSLWWFFKYHHIADRRIYIIRMMYLMDAMVAIVSTQRVILTFEEGAKVAAQSTPFFGIGVSAIFLLMGIRMLFKK